MGKVAKATSVAALVLAAAFLLAGNADAYKGTPKPPPPKSQPGSNGSPVQKTVKSCSLYATSSNFGLSCITGHAGDVTTVREILGKDDPPTCWDDPISDDDLQQKYQYVQNPDAPYYLHSCISGLDLDRSLYYQPDLQLNQQVIEIPKGAPDCKKPYTDAMTGTCVMTLTDNQRKVASATTGRVGQIPGITILTRPSTKVRTNEDVAYVDAATDENGNRITRTPDVTVGAVTLWAQMTDFKIYPYGPDGTGNSCDGTADVSIHDTPASMPNACWWRYPQSSAREPGETYPFRAEADWSVYYSVGGATFTLASFQKYDDLTLPVSDIQTIVIH